MKRPLRTRSTSPSKPDPAAGQRRLPIAKKGPLAHATLRVRIVIKDGSQLGPGKIDLLEAIERTGSISAAGREMNMSYRRAWLLVDELTHMFSRPLLIRSAGGADGGGAQLTDFGRVVIAAFRRIEERSRSIVREELAPFERDIIAK